MIERYAFDVETLMRGRAVGLTMLEVPVAWQQEEGSHVTPLSTAIKMAVDTLVIAYRLRSLERRQVRLDRPLEREVEAQPVRAGD